MGVNFMLWSRVGLSSLVFCGVLALSGVANAHYNDEGSSDGYGNGVYIAPIPASPMVRYHGYRHCSSHRMHAYNRHHHHMYGHNMYRGYYVCQKYTYEITPMHRDVACSDWKFEWLPATMWKRS